MPDKECNIQEEYFLDNIKSMQNIIATFIDRTNPLYQLKIRLT